MCLVASRVIHVREDDNGVATPIVFDKDFVVVKGLYETAEEHLYVTPVQQHPVKFKNGVAEISVEEFGTSLSSCGETVVEEGIHSFTQSCHANGWGAKPHFAVVPAGTEFYFGSASDMVSKKLLVFETEEDFEIYKETHEVDRQIDVWLYFYDALLICGQI